MSSKVSWSFVEVLAAAIAHVALWDAFLSVLVLMVSSSSCFVISSNKESLLLNIRLDHSSFITFWLCVFSVFVVGSSWLFVGFSVLKYLRLVLGLLPYCHYDQSHQCLQY